MERRRGTQKRDVEEERRNGPSASRVARSFAQSRYRLSRIRGRVATPVCARAGAWAIDIRAPARAFIDRLNIAVRDMAARACVRAHVRACVN
jgi:hypothetical protein